VVEGRRLEREVRLKDFRQAMALANKIAEIAEEQGHHPDLLVTWGRLKIMLFTHAIGGLHDNDFIMAARIDALLRPAVP
jgi:4a-hydroxytetrahydrobiopterin dehydratase